MNCHDVQKQLRLILEERLRFTPNTNVRLFPKLFYIDNLLHMHFIIETTRENKLNQHLYSSIKISAMHKFLIIYQRLGHVGKSTLIKLSKNQLLHFEKSDLDDVKSYSRQEDTCVDCHVANAHKVNALYPHTTKSAFRRNQIIGIDLMGPIDGPYLLVACDLFRKYRSAILVNSKEANEIVKGLENIMIRLEAESDTKIKTILSDNGTEFRNHLVQNMLFKRSIDAIYTPPEGSAVNGATQRSNGVIQQRIRSIMNSSHIYPHLWKIIVPEVIYLINITTISKTT